MSNRYAEHATQAAFVVWARLNRGRYPQLETLYAIPNGDRRDPRTGARLKREGVVAGIPDMCLPVAGTYGTSLYFEFKSPTGRLSPKQKYMRKVLHQHGNSVATVRTVDEAVGWTIRHLQLSKNN